MEYRGKRTCKILKDIRRQIAEANNIAWTTSDCSFKGDCAGTCPKCDDEVLYLERQLDMRRMAGKAVILAGISAGMLSFSSCGSSANISSDNNKYAISKHDNKSLTYVEALPVKKEVTAKEQKNIEVYGIVVDETNEPMIGVGIRVKGTDIGTTSDVDGKFELTMNNAGVLVFSFIGYEQIELNIKKSSFAHVVFTENAKSLLGEVPVVRKSIDDMYNRK